MAAITSIPVPPAIVAPASSSSQSASQDDDDNGFASELAAVRDDANARAQNKDSQAKDAQAKAASAKNTQTRDAQSDASDDAQSKEAQAKDAQTKDAQEKNSADAQPNAISNETTQPSDKKETALQQTASNDGQPTPPVILPQDIPVAAPVTDEATPEEIPATRIPDSEAAMDMAKPNLSETPVAEQPQQSQSPTQTQPTLPATQESKASTTEQKPVEKKAEADKPSDTPDADAGAAPPVAAPVNDVVPAMLPTAQFSEAPKTENTPAQNTDAAKIDGSAPVLRPSIRDSAKPVEAKATNPQSEAAENDGQPVEGQPVQPVKTEGDNGQHRGREQANERAQDVRAPQATEKSNESVVADSKPAAPQVPQAQSQQQGQPPASPHPAHGAPQIAGAVTQPQGLTQIATHTAVAFHTAPNTPAVADQVAIAISTQAKDGLQNFEIRMDPPELGRVEVKLSVDDNGKTQASVLVERPHTLELLQRDARSLEQALKDSGLNLTDNGLNFSLKGQDRQAQQEQNAPFVRAKILNMELTAAETAQAHINAMLPSGSARLDIRV